MNAVAISGTITQTPTSRETKNGKPYLTFTVDVVDGFRQDKKHTFNCIAFGKCQERLVGIAEGTVVGLSGSLQSRTFSTQQGERTVVEVVVDSSEVILQAGASRYEAEEGCQEDPFDDQ